MYHYQPPTDGELPSAMKNHLSSAYSLTALVSSSTNFSTINFAYGNNCFPATTDSVYAEKTFSAEEIDYQLDDLIDEVGEAEDGRAAVGIEDEDYTSSLAGADISSGYFDLEEGDYAALEPPPQEMYLQSLLDTDIETLMPYDPRLRQEKVGDGFYVSYYNGGAGAEEVAELEAEEEEEPLFTATPVQKEELDADQEPEPPGDLESRLGFRKAA